MEKYEQLAMVGEGSYGVVLKCKHKETDQIVAVKKFLETEEDAAVRRMALREIRMLKKLRHENLVTMIEVFRHRKRFYLVFEYLEGTLLDELEKMPSGLGDDRCRERIYQVTRAINFCHSNHIIHRDVKPENVLVSSLGVVKLCDFGFARLISLNGEPCTEYVATRWYRAPELLVGEQQYGSAVDIWAIGCLFAEMMTGDPLFPGDSDIDQLYLIIKLIGKPCARHQSQMSKCSHLRSIMKSAMNETNGLYKKFSSWSLLTLDFLVSCMRMDPISRPSSEELLKHNYFTHDRFPHKFLPALREKVLIEFNSNPLLRKCKADVLLSTDKKEEIRQRRSLQVEPPKWKVSLTEGSIKRKFSCDAITSESLSDKFNSNKSISQKSSQKYQINSSYFIKPKPKQLIVESISESKLERSLDNIMYSEIKEIPPDASPQTEPSQINVSLSVNSLKDTKKSPNFLQNIQGTSIKQTFHQVPLIHPPRGGHILKKLDKNIVLDSIFMNLEPITAKEKSQKTTKMNLNYQKDEFSLPNLTVSPNKTKKKQSLGDEVTPRIKSSTSHQSSKIFANFPSM
nr:cyclin-dependent kinase-like 4 [Onthophagus taurus]XP_022917149.1 cyclin-dependent kinase-like 4 [Onthophagus taurus]XP_022917150.1 cyclin-dependent kinase-like 4 [Onthophagus taurus]